MDGTQNFAALVGFLGSITLLVSEMKTSFFFPGFWESDVCFLVWVPHSIRAQGRSRPDLFVQVTQGSLLLLCRVAWSPHLATPALGLGLTDRREVKAN